MEGPRIGFIVPDNPAIQPTHKILYGRTVTLEPLSTAHSDDLFSCLGGSENLRIWDYMADGPFASKKEFNSFISQKAESEDPLFFSIVDRTSNGNRDSGRVTGFLSLPRIDVKNRVVEIGFVTFSRELQRTTPATETMYLLLKWVFEELNFRRCEWKCSDLNEPSKRAAERLGFVLRVCSDSI
ncbi:uncharacterized protein PADG_03918 [Paracoccidioides brasiliensis Pb18]|uniref:N-acetyltransferase domain-containing protein n=1 Tax=Paracoccidioides brasiliensis (strain Pb18) TaxID=502780 RepID=C1G9I2_PARBD|nr:uncharacterized protein PADG_03918 [Paracoccidioides brasiliensis Pb18]EEH47834.2 hypothetical protein PADG_03918 [Paracoccidioides brasiliensis Pb18]